MTRVSFAKRKLHQKPPTSQQQAAREGRPRRLVWTALAFLALASVPLARADEVTSGRESELEFQVTDQLDGSGTATPAVTPTPRAEVRVRGEVVEMACYLIGGRHGDTHKQCAIACARAGESLGIRDEKSGLLYLGVFDRGEPDAGDPLLPFIAQRVDVRGYPLEYGDLPALLVEEVTPLTSSR